MLGRLRLDVECSRGRRYPEPPHPYRNDFQRDRDRIVHSRAFRRMEGKTQVFAAGLCDHFRNRLTHTIEVSQVARTVANTLELNEDYTETLALVHDLGHPPFGHVGEKELDRQMHPFGATFEHNRHALRIVDHLENYYARFDGLNLTMEVREGIIKHSRELAIDTADEDLRALLPGKRPPLEAQLLDLADEIAYNIADLDDAFSAGLFSNQQIGETIPLFAELSEQIDTQFPGATERVRYWEVQRQLMNILIGGLIQGTVQAADEAQVQTVEDVRDLDYRLARLTEDALTINRQMRTLLIHHVYANAELISDRKLAQKRLGRLFQYLVEHPECVSAGYRESLKERPAHRVVCDYIAGMTDQYFLKRYRALFPDVD
jgi:dGTPase